MTQLPVLNFAQLLASHGAPLMPAQLTALMSALQNYNDSSSNTVRISSEPVSCLFVCLFVVVVCCLLYICLLVFY